MPDSRIEIAKGNIDKLRQKRAILSEKELAHVNELAEILCDEAGEEEIFFFDEAFISRYKELTKPFTPSDVSALNAERVGMAQELQLYTEKAFLTARICDIFGIKGIRDVTTFFEGLSDDEINVISCVKSPMSDEAYMQFSSVLSDPRVAYADDFAQACENVYYGRSNCCILPFASSTDGRLSTFRSLALKYGLKIAYVCRVENPDGGVISFALMKKELVLPSSDEKLYFELRIKNCDSMTELTCVSSVFGMEVAEMSYFSGEGGYVDMTLRVRDDSICGFLSYLYLQYPDFIPVGLFKEI